MEDEGGVTEEKLDDDGVRVYIVLYKVSPAVPSMRKVPTHHLQVFFGMVGIYMDCLEA